MYLFDTYQKAAKNTAIYPNQNTMMGIVYVSLGMAGESGEIANKVKKILRDDKNGTTVKRRNELIDELGDVLWYVSQMATELGINLENVAKLNILKLAKRKSEGTLKGNGDNR